MCQWFLNIYRIKNFFLKLQKIVLIWYDYSDINIFWELGEDQKFICKGDVVCEK